MPNKQFELMKEVVEAFAVLADEDQARTQAELSDVLQTADQLLAEFSTVQDVAREIERQAAPNFNLFKVLNVERNEVETHSAFLRYLLDDSASHGQQDLFIHTFLQSLGWPKADRWQVVCEYDCGMATEGDNTRLGRIDLLIRGQINGHAAAIAIENKIDAVDQDLQLQRYAAYLQKSFGKDCLKQKDRSLLIYLTPDGHPPAQSSLGKLERQDVMLMSYKQHIHEWLSQTLKTVSAAPVACAIQQYLETIREL